MAFLKLITLPTGATAEYWRIDKNRILISQGEMIIPLLGYVTKEARDSNKLPIDSKEIRFPIEEVQPYGTDLINMTYLEIKKLEEWSESTDI